MEDDDLLGDKGRKLAASCVKVATLGRPLHRYSRVEALERLGGCFAKLPNGMNMDSLQNVLPHKPNGTYNILDIKEALSKLDKDCDVAGGEQKHLLATLPNVSEAVGSVSDDPNYEYPKSFQERGPVQCSAECGYNPDKDDSHKGTGAGKYPKEQTDFKCLEQEIDQCRSEIEKEYKLATSDYVEIDHGTGFIISDHFLITNKHVVEDALNDKTKKIRISNEVIGDLYCEINDHVDPGNDLALLYCKDLNVEQNGICPLPLCTQTPPQSKRVFIFGYPFTYTGKSALFVKGYVSGSVERYGRPSFMVLYCSVCPGNSGGPVLCSVNRQLKVVAVLAQRHKKNIMSVEEKNTVEALRASMETMADFKDHGTRPDTCQTAKLIAKLFDAVEETHCQFGLCNAVPGSLVVDFLKKYKGDGKEELDQVVKCSEDHVNVLPSGYHHASDCTLC